MTETIETRIAFVGTRLPMFLPTVSDMVAEVYKFATKYPHSYIRAHTAHRDAYTGQMEWQVSVADQTGRHTFVLIQAVQYGPIKVKAVNEAAA